MIFLLFCCAQDEDSSKTIYGQSDSGAESSFVESEPPESTCVDDDADGWCAAEDCDDSDDSRHPDATEFCDGVDQDCDGTTDEDAGGTYYADNDGDGFGDPEQTAVSCESVLGYVDNGSDCDDTDPNSNPGAGDDNDDGVDNDCDGLIDEDFVPISVEVTWSADGVEVLISGGAPGWNFGMAETGPGSVGWFGETCILGTEPWGYPDYGYNVCHTLAAEGGFLYSIYPNITETRDGYTLFNETIGNSGDITYILLDTSSADCYVFGNDITYYDDFGCTPI